MRRVAWSLLCVLCLAATAWAEPKAVIQDPGPIQPGDFVLLDGSKSSGTRIEWRLSNGQPFLVADGGAKIATGSRQGRFVVVLVVGDGAEFDVAILEIDPGKTPVPPTPPGPGPKPPSPPTPVPVPPPGPAEPLRALVQPVVALAIEPADAAELAAFFLATKWAASNPSVATTAKFREAYMAAGATMFGSRLKGKYPTLASAIDAALTATLGLDVRDLTADDRAKLAALCDALAWAVGAD